MKINKLIALSLILALVASYILGVFVGGNLPQETKDKAPAFFSTNPSAIDDAYGPPQKAQTDSAPDFVVQDEISIFIYSRRQEEVGRSLAGPLNKGGANLVFNSDLDKWVEYTEWRHCGLDEDPASVVSEHSDATIVLITTEEYPPIAVYGSARYNEIFGISPPKSQPREYPPLEDGV